MSILAKKTKRKKVISVDGVDYDASSLSENAKARFDDLQFINEQIMQKNNELQISDSARIMYASAFKSGLIKSS